VDRRNSPNKSFSGTPSIIGGKNALNSIKDLNFNWGTSSPHPSVPSNNFSARFTKKVNLKTGTYIFTANGNEGVRVKLDNQLIINAWPNTNFKEKYKQMNVKGGNHTITVEYYEAAGSANLSFDYHLYTQFPVKTGKTVRQNWGWGSPGNGAGADYFMADYDQSGSYLAGDYFLQAFADDGVKVEVDGKTLINRWSDYTGKLDRSLCLGVKSGKHTVKTHYLEKTGNAAVYSDVVPLDSWLAYYYPNDQVSGMPTAAKVIPPKGTLKKLYQNFGTNSPAAGIAADHFSARYTTAKRISAGTYVLRAKADDGIRVYVDGKLVVNSWKSAGYRENAVKLNIADRNVSNANEKNAHWIQVDYFDSTSAAKLDVSLEPFQQEYVNSWVGEVFPNKNLTGTPYIIGGKNSLNPITDLHFNWGTGSPLPSVKGDNFSVRFTKKLTLTAGTYRFVSNGDDGVRVRLDNQLISNQWPNTGFKESRNALYINAGVHTISVEYYEGVRLANLSFDFEKLSPNKIYYQQEKSVQHNWGLGGPASFPTDGFEALFDQSGNYQGGDYFLQTFADDGVKVDVDGQPLINRWTDYTGKVDRALWLGAGSGNHTVQTHYYDNVSNAAIFSDVVPFDSWLAYYFPNETLSGMPAASKVIAPLGQYKSLSEDFGENSPAAGVDKDHFSARYTTAKRISAGNYLLRASADDGERVYVDGKLVLDSWSNGALKEDTVRLKITNRSDAAQREQDVHWIEVEYHDYLSVGSIHVSIEPLIGPIYLTTTYTSTLSHVVDLQMNTTPQTDLYAKYLREDGIAKDANGNWHVTGSGWNVRGGPGTNYSIVGTINGGTQVWIEKTITTPGQPTWYQVSTFMNALRSDVEHYVNSANFTKGSTEYFQFLKLSENAGLNANEVNEKILDGKGILQGKASSFIEAGTKFGVNEVYLISHALLETGNGTSNLATGILVSKVDGQDVSPKIVYNMYGINAKDSCPLQCGSEYAYKMGWTTPEAAIVDGAKFIASNYISRGQDTLYKMRWNPGQPGTHQYASDIGWALKQIYRIKELYDSLANYVLVFDEPKYQ
jgi:beta-N-acetylglucosaminidase